MHISSNLKVYFGGLRPVATGNSPSPPAPESLCEIQGELDNLSASQSDAGAESLFNKAPAPLGLSHRYQDRAGDQTPDQGMENLGVRSIYGAFSILVLLMRIQAHIGNERSDLPLLALTPHLLLPDTQTSKPEVRVSG